MINDDKALLGSSRPYAETSLSSSEKARNDMRKLAEKIASEDAYRLQDSDTTVSVEKMRSMLHELRVHQIELEMQNGELRQTQIELDASRARYYDLYDLAPVGYMTISESGIIVESNLTAANILGSSRGLITKQALSRFITREDQDSYYIFRNKLKESYISIACELRMQTMNGEIFRGRLEGIAREGIDGVIVSRIVLSDVSAYHHS